MKSNSPLIQGITEEVMYKFSNIVTLSILFILPSMIYSYFVNSNFYIVEGTLILVLVLTRFYVISRRDENKTLIYLWTTFMTLSLSVVMYSNIVLVLRFGPFFSNLELGIWIMLPVIYLYEFMTASVKEKTFLGRYFSLLVIILVMILYGPNPFIYQQVQLRYLISIGLWLFFKTLTLYTVAYFNEYRLITSGKEELDKTAEILRGSKKEKTELFVLYSLLPIFIYIRGYIALTSDLMIAIGLYWFVGVVVYFVSISLRKQPVSLKSPKSTLMEYIADERKKRNLGVGSLDAYSEAMKKAIRFGADLASESVYKVLSDKKTQHEAVLEVEVNQFTFEDVESDLNYIVSNNPFNEERNMSNMIDKFISTVDSKKKKLNHKYNIRLKYDRSKKKYSVYINSELQRFMDGGYFDLLTSFERSIEN